MNIKKIKEKQKIKENKSKILENEINANKKAKKKIFIPIKVDKNIKKEEKKVEIKKLDKMRFMLKKSEKKTNDFKKLIKKRNILKKRDIKENDVKNKENKNAKIKKEEIEIMEEKYNDRDNFERKAFTDDPSKTLSRKNKKKK